MAIEVTPTPNPNAMKLTVGEPVGGPATFAAGSDPDEPAAAALLALPGVVSVFMTADFVTVTRAPDQDWDTILPAATAILADHFG